MPLCNLMLAGLLWFLGYASWSVLLLHLSDTGPSVALTTCPVWLLLRAWQASFFNARRYVLAGVAFALAALVRPVVGLYVIILGVGMFFWFAVRRHSRRAIAATAMLWLLWRV